MAEQWDPSRGDSRGPVAPGLNRNALQATLADLVRDADGPAGSGTTGAAPAPAGAGPAGGPMAGGPSRPVVPGAPVPTPSAGPRPLRGPSAMRPVIDDVDDDSAPGGSVRPVTASADESQPAPGGGASRPAPSGRPKLPFGPEPAPVSSGTAGAVHPGSGGAGGFNSGIGGNSTGGNSIGGNGFGGGGSLGAGSLSGRITPGDLGDNLARLSPTPTEQPTIPLRKRRPAGDAEAERPPGADAAAGSPNGAKAAPAQASRPAAVIEAWSPQYDDILPQRPTRTGRAFRRAR